MSASLLRARAGGAARAAWRAPVAQAAAWSRACTPCALARRSPLGGSPRGAAPCYGWRALATETRPPGAIARRASSRGHPRRERWYDVWRIGSDGSRNRAPITHTELLGRASLFPRDMLTFDVSSDPAENRVSASRPPRVLVRQDAIMITAGHIRCVLRREEIFLFDAHSTLVSDFAHRLEGKLAEWAAFEVAAGAAGGGGGGGQEEGAGCDDPASVRDSFEMRVLDHVLAEVASSYTRRAALLSPIVDALLPSIVADTGPYSMDENYRMADVSTLMPLRDSLHAFESEASDLLKVLMDLLSSDEDMLDMLLSEKATLDGARPPVQHHEAVELLLEEYARQMAMVVAEAQALKKRVVSAAELARLHLDISRNRMVAMNVHLAMVSTSLALTMTASGLFGMNLTSGFEEAPGVFGIVAAGSAVASVAMLGGCWAYLHGFRGAASRRRILSRQLESSSAVRRVFRRLDSLQFVLAKKLPPELTMPLSGGGALSAEPLGSDGQPLSADALRRELEQASGVPLTQSELGIIMRALDTEERDGKVSASEIAALWRRYDVPRQLWTFR